MDPIFKHSDLKLCEVPVPVGYPQSQTHLGIAHYGGKFYLTASPYPGPVYGKNESRFRHLLRILSFGKLCEIVNGEYYENPCLYIGEDNDNQPPTRFSLMHKSALMDTPDRFYGFPSFNSDPDIFIEKGIIHILNRSVIRTKVYENNRPYDFDTRIYMIKGVDENGLFKLQSIQLVRDTKDSYISPSLTFFRGKYMVSFLDNRIIDRELKFKGLYLSIGNSIEEALNNKVPCRIMINDIDMIPWHMSLFHHNDSLYTIITCVCKGDVSLKMWQMLGRFSDDLSRLEIYPTPLTDYNSYRGSALVDDYGNFILYTPTVHERVTGASSVDGRDVLVGIKKFDDVLTLLKQ